MCLPEAQVIASSIIVIMQYVMAAGIDLIILQDMYASIAGQDYIYLEGILIIAKNALRKCVPMKMKKKIWSIIQMK